MSRSVALELDRERLVNGEQGRRGWLRGGGAVGWMSCAGSRPGRSPAPGPSACASRSGGLWKSTASSSSQTPPMRAYRARGVMKDGRRFGRPAGPHTPPPAPTGTIDTTDHDSRIVRTQGRPPIQGYNARAAVNENQIHRRRRAQRRLARLRSPRADRRGEPQRAGQRWCHRVTADGRRRPWPLAQAADRERRRPRHPGGDPARLGPAQGRQTGIEQGSLRVHAPTARNRARPGHLSKTTGDGRARVRTNEVQPAARSPLTPRASGVPLGMAPHRRHPQPAQAPQPPDRRHSGLTGPKHRRRP
jgi:hypothetical protein